MKFWFSRIAVAASLVAGLAVLSSDVFGGTPQAKLAAPQGSPSTPVAVEASNSPVMDKAGWQLTGGTGGTASSSSNKRR